MTGLVLGALLAGRGAAQDAPAARLSVRPHELKGAERTWQAGDVALDALPGYSLYVPPLCAAKEAPRCPLAVVAADLPPNVIAMPQTTLGWLRPVADKYGLIVLALNPYLPIQMDSARQRNYSESLGIDPRQLDAALTQVLQKVAVDPDRIALVDYVSLSVAEPPQAVHDAWPMAVANLDVFSRVVRSASVRSDLRVPPAPAGSPRLTRFLVTAEVSDNDASSAFAVAGMLRHEGYPAELLFSLKSIGRGMWEELDYIGRWLRDSWATPTPAPVPTAPRTTNGGVADSLPRLTPEAVGRLARFWTSFQQEPDSIRRLGRRAHLRAVLLPFGAEGERPVTWMTDMAALARQYPSVAAKLTSAGLTAEEHEAYRLALVSARVARALGDSADAMVAPSSTLAQNAEFLGAPGDNEVFPSEELRPVGPDSWLPLGMWESP